MFIKNIYPGTKIIVRRKKVEGTLLTYTNELEVEVNFDEVDPSLLHEGNEVMTNSTQILSDSSLETTPESFDNEDPQDELDLEKPKRRLSRFFNKG